MQRVGFMIKVRADKLEEYRKLHNPIWPELAAELRAAGMRNYSIWQRPDGLEFGYLECDDWEKTCRHLAAAPAHTRWQELMKNYLETPTDSSAGGQPVVMLEKVFQLEE